MESATESRPPMALRGTGKGETVRQELTSVAGDCGGSVNPTRSKAKQGCRRPVDQVPGRPLERIGNGASRWMVVLDRIRLTGGLATVAEGPERGAFCAIRIPCRSHEGISFVSEQDILMAMTKRLIDVDDDKLDAVRALVSTTTLKSTVDAALDEVLALDQRRRGLLAERGVEIAELADSDARQAAWR